MRRLILAALLLAGPVLAQAQGEAWRPERPMTIVLPYAPGSAADAYARAMGDVFTRRFGQAVAVVNRDGASGTVGMRYVAQQPADGLTLGITPMTPIVVQPHMVRNLGIGPESFAPVCGIAENILGVVVRADSPLRDLPGLVALARSRPLQFGSPGPNSLPFLGVWRMQRAAGIEMTHVPFRGDPPSVNEVMGGRLDFAAVVVASASELIGSGRLRLLGVFSGRRHPDFPEVPTAREQGLDAEQLSFVGLYAPRGTPERALAALEEACRVSLESDGFKRVAAQANVVAAFRTRAQFTEMVQAEFGNYARILRELGVQAE